MGYIGLRALGRGFSNWDLGFVVSRFANVKQCIIEQHKFRLDAAFSNNAKELCEYASRLQHHWLTLYSTMLPANMLHIKASLIGRLASLNLTSSLSFRLLETLT